MDNLKYNLIIPTSRMKKVLLFLFFVFSFLAFNLNIVEAQESTDGMSFDDKKHTTTKLFKDLPATVEFEIYLPAGHSARSGVIFGNFTRDGIKNALEFEIASGGKPRFYYHNINGEVVDIRFNTTVKTGDWVSIAYVYDEINEKIYCYNDGILCEEIDTVNSKNFEKFTAISPAALNEYFVVGGDNRTNNSQFFQGQIRSITLYNDVKAIDEITAVVDLNDEDLISYYEMNGSTTEIIKDLSGNNYDFKYCSEWIEADEKEPVKDYAYSFAIVGDTQYLGWASSKNNDVANVPTQDRMNVLYKWLADNVESKKIEFVIGLGDITDDDTDAEWKNAASSISMLDGVVPYSLIRGNHDTSEMFFKTFGNETYMSQFDGFYQEGSINSSYKALRVGKTDYLFLTLDYGADDAELAWAGSVIEAHPTHKVIISTHTYLYKDGTTISTGDDYSPNDSNDVDFSIDKEFNDGQDMWEKLISKYANIEFVLSGHDPSPNVMNIQVEGVHGNIVNQMLIDAQNMDRDIFGATGMVCMFYFNEDGSQMEIEYYSTIRNQFYRVTNEYTVDLSNTGTNVHNYSDYYNETHHWQMCDDCGRETEKIAHVYDNDGDDKCNICGAIRKIDSHLEHSFTDVKSDEYVHYHECSVCHARDELSLEVHKFDNLCDKDCNECGYERSTEHNYSVIKNDGENYWKECSWCGDKIPTEAPMPEPSSGCSGSIIGTVSITIFLIVTSIVILFLKKRQLKNN